MANIFPWKKTESQREKAIKWTVTNAKYEIYVCELDEIELSPLVAHCMDVRNKVLSVLSVDAHKTKSLMRAFPRTISFVLRTIWDNVVAEFADDPEEADFDVLIKHFIAAHCTPDDRHDLLSQLCTGAKPRHVGVQQYYYRLLELNGYVDWLPGFETELQDNEIKVAFHGPMPSSWRERSTGAGKSVHAESTAEKVRYFRSQETFLALRKQAENEASNESKSARLPDNKTKGNGKRKFKPPHSNGGNKKPPSKRRVDADSDCPIHPGSHKWA